MQSPIIISLNIEWWKASKTTLLNPYNKCTRLGSINAGRSNDRTEVNGTASGFPESKIQEA